MVLRLLPSSECSRLSTSSARSTPSISCLLLGAHEVPLEYREKRQQYVDLLIEEMIPEVERSGLAEWCDFFCEAGVFSIDESRSILPAAREHGMKLRIHADEFADPGGTKLAIALGARSADHLIRVSPEGIRALARSDMVETLLPPASFYLKQYYAPARTLIDAGAVVALATDLNPGGGYIHMIAFWRITGENQLSVSDCLHPIRGYPRGIRSDRRGRGLSMGKIKAIRSEADYNTALARIDTLMDAEAGTLEGEELDVLTDLVEHYEAKHVPMGFPSPGAAVEFRLQQAGLSQRDLVPFIGSRAKVSEVLSGKRQLTMSMARALHEHLGIPAEVLLQQAGATFSEPLEDLDWNRFPLKAMAKLGWIPAVPNLASRAKELMGDLIRRAGGPEVAASMLYRKSNPARANVKTEPYALKAWCWKVLAEGNANRPSVSYERGTVTLELLRQLARLSWLEEGPVLAKEFLAKHGIPLVSVSHLPKTYLDGAALKLADGTPVIGLTLRYDRLDNFWFCLLHELAHVGRHMDIDGEGAFVDDLTLRDVEGVREDPKELQADEWAEEALIPRAIWETSVVRQQPTPMSVISFANALQVHPAIVAGRIRHEQKNYRLLSQFVGTGQVRPHFGMVA